MIFIPIVIFIIVGVSNGANLTDGIDGTAPTFTSGSPDSDATDDDSDGYAPYPASASLASRPTEAAISVKILTSAILCPSAK